MFCWVKGRNKKISLPEGGRIERKNYSMNNSYNLKVAGKKNKKERTITAGFLCGKNNMDIILQPCDG